MTESKNICDYRIIDEENKLIVITNNIVNYFSQKGKIDLNDDNFYLWYIEDISWNLRLWTSVDFRLADRIRQSFLFTDFMLYLNKEVPIYISRVYFPDGFKRIYGNHLDEQTIYKRKFMTYWEIYLEKLFLGIYYIQTNKVGVILKWKSF